MNEAVINQIRSFWRSYSESTLDFSSMGQLVRGAFKIINFKAAPEMLDELEKMTLELEKYLPLMDLKEFLYCTSVVRYARTQIQLRRGISYATGLKGEFSAADRDELLRGTRPAGDSDLDADASLDGNDFAAGLCDDDDDSDES
jgi:hypothetical protein